MNKEEIGQFIRNERKKQNLSQKELAEKCGIGRYQQILEIEKAQFDYSIGVLLKIMEGLGYDLHFYSLAMVSPVQPEPDATASFQVFDFSNVEPAEDPEKDKKLVSDLKKSIKIITSFKRKTNNNGKTHKQTTRATANAGNV